MNPNLFNAFDLAKELHGGTVIDGVEYAIGQAPRFDNSEYGLCYLSYGFTRQDLDEHGYHDPMVDIHVILVWPCGCSTEEYQGNWETDAILGNQL